MIDNNSLHICVFFFQAEDGIRDLTVTGVQTCALPISRTTSLPSNPVAPVTATALPPVAIVGGTGRTGAAVPVVGRMTAAIWSQMRCVARMLSGETGGALPDWIAR